MKIRTKLDINTIIVGFFLLLFIGIVLYRNTAIQQAFLKDKITESITENSFELTLLRNDYLAYPSERAKTQWNSVYTQQLQLLDTAKPLFSSPEEKLLIDGIVSASTARKMLTDELIKNVESGGSQPVIQELNNQLTVNAQVSVSDAQSLVALTQNQVNSDGQIFNIIVIVFGLLFVLVYGITYYLTVAVGNSLRKLGEGTMIIAGGNLQYQLPVASHDEIGMVSELFNQMTFKLKESYDTLEKKVLVRTYELEREKNISERFAAIVRDANEPIISKKLDGTIVSWNRAAERLYGFTASEVIGKSVKIIFPEDKYDELDQILKTVAGGGSMDHYRTVRMKKDGSLVNVSVSASPIKDVSGHVIEISVISLDITKESAIDKAKSEFVSLASHQLKTPATAISWLSERLTNKKLGDLNEKQLEYFNDIRTTNQRMIELVNALLNVSRIELEAFPIQPTLTDVYALVKNLVGELKLPIKNKKIKFEESYPKNSLDIFIDESLFGMVINNIVTNAIHYTPVGGDIKISCSQVLAGEMAGDKKMAEDCVLISVADTGCGIPKDQQDKLFTKFFRADNARRMKTDGTGLGLYIVKSILENSGGLIWFDSKENKGTTFYVVIPLSGMKQKTGTQSLLAPQVSI